MRLRVLMVWLRRPRTSTLWPLIATPWVSSASTVNLTLPRRLAHEPAFTPSTTALGQSAMLLATVCTSPLGSLYVTSALISLGRVIIGRSLSVKLAAPFLSVVSGSLSATSLASFELVSVSLSSLPVCAFEGSRGGSNENSS